MNRDEENISHRRTEPSTKMKYASSRNTIAYRPLWGSHHRNPVRSLSTTKWDLLKMIRKPSLCPVSSPVPPLCWNHRREDTSRVSCISRKRTKTIHMAERRCIHPTDSEVQGLFIPTYLTKRGATHTPTMQLICTHQKSPQDQGVQLPC